MVDCSLFILIFLKPNFILKTKTLTWELLYSQAIAVFGGSTFWCCCCVHVLVRTNPSSIPSLIHPESFLLYIFVILPEQRTQINDFCWLQCSSNWRNLAQRAVTNESENSSFIVSYSMFSRCWSAHWVRRPFVWWNSVD